MKNVLNGIYKLIFCVALTFGCFTMNSNSLDGYWGSMGSMLVIFKLFIVFVIVLIATHFNKDNIKFVSIAEPIIVVVATVLLIIDYKVTKISGSQFLFTVWWIGAVFMSQAGVFTAVTISSDKTNYKAFYRRFWIGFTPIYVYTFALCFARTPFVGNSSTNIKLGDGTFRMLYAFIGNLNVDFEAPLIFFGNLLILIPLAFILNAIFKKLKTTHIAIIGTITPFIIEGYQYIFKCGDVDIDDIVLNLLGFYIGLIAMNIISKKYIKP